MSKQKTPRKVKTPRYKSFKLTKKLKVKRTPLPGFFKLFGRALTLLRQNKSLFGGIILINCLLSLVFVAGLTSSFDFVQTKNNIEEFVGEDVGRASLSVTLFGYLISTAGAQAGEIAGTYQLFLTLITSLAIIWAVRQVLAGEKASAKDAFYHGIYPLVPFLLVFAVIALQLVPAIIGMSIYGIIVSGGLAVTALENALWLILLILLCLLSLYMMISSVFALYIVTLPEMTPLKALRSARGLVAHRRLSVSVRIIALPLVLLLAVMVLILPAIIFLPWLATILFLLFGSLSLYLGHSYMYHLYRSLL